VSLDQLRARINRLEDLLAVQATIAGYGLTIDGGMTTLGGNLWTEDCLYDSDGAANGGYRTRAEMEALIDAARAATLGFAHLTNLPAVVVDGDRASAYAASHLPIAADGQQFSVSRVSANKWDLRRVDGQWQIQQRTSRVLGSSEATEIFAEGARAVTVERESLADRVESTVGESEMSSAEEFAELDHRIRALEDQLAVLQVVAGYGPSMDGGAAREAGLLWTEDSWYDTDSSPAASVPHGRAGIEGAAARAREEPTGLAHISHMPLIKIDGDRATVVNHSNTFEQDGDGFRVGRVSSNRWELVRVGGAWQIERRVNRLLDGSKAARELFAEGTNEIIGA
jgi:hypothetical protein